MSSILNIKEERVTYESELKKKDEFIGVKGMIDSLYYFYLIKVGKETQGKNLNEVIKTINKDFPSRNSWSNNDFIYVDEISLNQNFTPWFNTSIIPLKNIQSIEMYIKGDTISEEKINDNLITYSINTHFICISFNNFNKNDFSYSSFYNSESSIIFIKDKNSNLYIMSLAPIGEPYGKGLYKLKAPYKTLEEILDFFGN